MNSQILDQASHYVSGLFQAGLPEGYTYHTPAHTAEVAAACLEIGSAHGLTPKEMELLQLAAWFHDTGYLEVYEGHEQASARIAREFLQARGYPEADIARVEALIRATFYLYRPASLIEEVIRDADLVYVGRDNYIRQSETLRTEWKKMLGKIYTDSEWLDSNIDFLAEHTFHTPYARSHYGATHQRNLKELVMIREKMG